MSQVPGEGLQYFSLYNDCNVPFLSSNSTIGKQVHKIIQADMDDDVQTDPEQEVNAKRML